jgi:ribosomal protein S18 acetylase RimI-like enzyme
VASIIRLYRPEDRAAVLQIAADTGYFGAPVEAFMDDRHMMQDAFVSYYLDCEPEYTWVAEVDGVVEGYITASTGSRRETRCWLKLYARALGRFLTLRYRLGRLTLRYGSRAALAVLAGEYPHADPRLYPAELHINLTERTRGLGLGRRLLQTCLDQMTDLGVPGIHLSTTNLNGAAVHLYEKMGFQLLARHRTRVWEPWMPGVEVENLVYGKRLSVAG